MSDFADRFYARVMEEFDLDPSTFDPEALIINDLGFDSLDVLRLAIVVDQFVPMYELPLDLDPADTRLSDVAYYMENHLNARASARPE